MDDNMQLGYNDKMASQSGRSMVEMLGVLTIIAVLSIAAVFGYSYAMNKHKSNMILNDVHMLTTLVISSGFLQKPDMETTTPQELNIEISSPFSYLISKGDSTTFYITAQKIPYGVCKQLILENIPYVAEIVPNPMSSKLCEKTDLNEVDFYVHEGEIQNSEKPESNVCDDETPCGDCQQCVRGRCVDRDEKCPSGQSCQNGVCTCGEGRVTGKDGKCYGCDNIPSSTPVTIPDECRKCTGRTITSGDRCYACGAMFWLMTTEEDCNRCTNITGQRFFGSNKNVGSCGLCWVDVNPESTKAQCAQCSNRYFEGDNDMSGTCKICKGVVSADGRSCTPA